MIENLYFAGFVVSLIIVIVVLSITGLIAIDVFDFTNESFSDRIPAALLLLGVVSTVGTVIFLEQYYNKEKQLKKEKLQAESIAEKKKTVDEIISTFPPVLQPRQDPRSISLPPLPEQSTQIPTPSVQPPPPPPMPGARPLEVSSLLTDAQSKTNTSYVPVLSQPPPLR